MADPCTCVTDIEAKLTEHRLNMTMNFREGESSRAIIGLIRRDNWRPETRRSKPTSFLASYCPFCGQKYVEDLAKVAQ